MAQNVHPVDQLFGRGLEAPEHQGRALWAVATPIFPQKMAKKIKNATNRIKLVSFKNIHIWLENCAHAHIWAYLFWP